MKKILLGLMLAAGLVHAVGLKYSCDSSNQENCIFKCEHFKDKSKNINLIGIKKVNIVMQGDTVVYSFNGGENTTIVNSNYYWCEIYKK